MAWKFRMIASNHFVNVIKMVFHGLHNRIIGNILADWKNDRNTAILAVFSRILRQCRQMAKVLQ
jgi:hypothetical protein